MVNTFKQPFSFFERDALRDALLPKREVLDKVGFTITTDVDSPGKITLGMLNSQGMEYNPDSESNDAWLLSSITGKVSELYKNEAITARLLLSVTSSIAQIMRSLYPVRFTGEVILQRWYYNDYNEKVISQSRRITY